MRRTLIVVLAVSLAAPAAAHALPAKGTIGFGGIAGVSTGMARSDAEARWGAPDACSELSGSTVCNWGAGRSVAKVVFDAGGHVERTILQGPKRGRPGALGGYRTAQGVGLGTNVDRMLNAYPRDPFNPVNGGLVALVRRNRDQSVAMALTASPGRGGRVSRVVVGSNDPLGASRTFKPARAGAEASARPPLRMKLEYNVGVDVIQPDPDCKPPTTQLSSLEASFHSAHGYRVAAGLKRGNRRAADVRNRLDLVTFGGFERVGVGMGVGAEGLVRMRASGLCDDHGGEVDTSQCENHPKFLFFRPLDALVRGTARRYAYVNTSLLQSSKGGLDSILLPGCGDVNMRQAFRPLSFVVPAGRLLAGGGTMRIPAVGNGTEVVVDDESGRRTTTTQHAFLILSRPRPGAAQSEPPACEPAKNGSLVQARATDPNVPQGSRALYATHRITLRAFAEERIQDDSDGSRYNIVTDSERIAPGPEVVDRLAFVRDAPGPLGLPILWTIERGPFGGPYEPYCTASETVPLTLRKPKPTSLLAERRLVDTTGAWPRVHLAIAGRASDDLRPVSIRIRRGARGRARTLFTLPLANVRSETARYRFSKRFAGMRIKSGPRDASMEARGLVVVGVSVPKLRDKRRLRRDFTLEVVREGGVLMRVRAVLACRGVGTLQPVQVCTAPVWRVTRPRR